MLEEPKKFHNLLVYRKALEIFKVSRAIACSLSESKNIFEMETSTELSHRFAGQLVTQSLRLAPDLAVVQNASCHDSRLKGAKRIRKASRKLLTKCKKLEFLGVREKEFLDLLKSEILQFEQLFAEWFYNHQLNKDA